MFSRNYFFDMSKIIGLTGGIGSGKSTVAAYFLSQGIPIYTADIEAKNILDTEEIFKMVEATFGDTVFTDGKVDRKKLSAVVFSNSEKLEKLNAIIHPAVLQHFKEWILRNQHFPIVIKEAAILFESGGAANCDAVITVTAPVDLRVDRVMRRDHVTRDEVLQRIENQWTDEQRIEKSDFIIENIDLHSTMAQSAAILKKLHNL